MAQAVADEELAEGIKRARKKACNFALICKGPQPVKLIVRKKAILEGELAKAKAEFKGNAVVSGICVGSGAELEFHVLGSEEPGVKVGRLKEFIAEQAEVTTKAVWKCVTSLPAIETDDETTGGATAAPTLSPEAKALLDKLKTFAPALHSAVAANPAQRGEIVGLVEAVKQQAAGEEIDAAKLSLQMLGGMLQKLAALPSGASPAKANETAPPADNALAQRWNDEFAALEPRYLEALKKADDQLASQLKVLFAFATEQAEAGDHARALRGLERLAPLVQQALDSTGPSGPGKTPTGKVAAAVLRSELQTIRTNAARGLAQLAAALKGKSDPRARQIEPIVAKLAQNMPTELEETLQQLDAAVKSGDASAAQSLRRDIQQKAKGWLTFLQAHAHEIDCSENNPWGIAVAIAQPVRDSLTSILKTTR